MARRKRLAPPNKPPQQFKFAETTIRYIDMAMQYSEEELKNNWLVRDLLQKAGINPTFENSWKYKNDKQVLACMEAKRLGKPHRIKKMSGAQGYGGMSQQKRIGFELFWQHMEADLEMNIRRCAEQAGVPYDEARTMVDTTEGQTRIKEMVARRKEKHSDLATALIEGLKQKAFFDFGDLFDRQHSEENPDWFGRLLNIHRMPPEARQIITSYKVTNNGPEIKTEAKHPYYNLLARALGLLQDTQQEAMEDLAADLRRFAEEVGSAVPGGVL